MRKVSKLGNVAFETKKKKETDIWIFEIGVRNKDGWKKVNFDGGNISSRGILFR